MRTYHVAILECDTPADAVARERGTYGDIFTTFLRRGHRLYRDQGGTTEVDLQITTSNVVSMGSLPALEEVNCILLTGSKHDASSDDPWILRLVDYVKKAFETSDVHILGICFGHQIVGRALGGIVARNSQGWEVSVERIDLSPMGKTLLGLESLALHQMHRDILTNVPTGVQTLGHSPRCEVQGLYCPKMVLTFQAHPEFDAFIISTIVEMRHEQRVFDDALYKDAMARVTKEHDGPRLSIIFWKFMLDELV